MKGFSEDVRKKLIRFMSNGDGIVRQLTEKSFARSNMHRYRNVRYNLQQTIADVCGIENYVHFYGSRVCGTSLFSSDLDFFVQMGKF